MVSKKSIVIATLFTLMVFSGYTCLVFGFGDSCLSLDAIGCLKFGDSCLMYCKITIDDSYRQNNDVPILVIKEHGTENVVVIEELGYIGSVEDCDEYECSPEVQCDASYDIAIYINDTTEDPILSSPVVSCP